MNSENLSSLIWLSVSDGRNRDSSKVVSFMMDSSFIAALICKRDKANTQNKPVKFIRP